MQDNDILGMFLKKKEFLISLILLLIISIELFRIKDTLLVISEDAKITEFKFMAVLWIVSVICLKVLSNSQDTFQQSFFSSIIIILLCAGWVQSQFLLIFIFPSLTDIFQVAKETGIPFDAHKSILEWASFVLATEIIGKLLPLFAAIYFLISLVKHFIEKCKIKMTKQSTNDVNLLENNACPDQCKDLCDKEKERLNAENSDTPALPF